MEKGKHQVGYSGADSMRAKAQRLFGNAVEGVDMTDVLSASAPSKTPMRKYAKGGHVKATGSMMPHKAKGEVQGGTLTDMHMPKKINTKAFKKGGSVKKEVDEVFGAEPNDKAAYKKWMNKREEAGVVSPLGAGHDADMKRKRMSEALKKATRQKAYSDQESERKMSMGGQVKPLACGYGRPKVQPVAMEEAQEAQMKKGGKVRAKTTSPMRKAVKGRTKNVDMSTKKGNVLDVGSVKQNATPKKASMLKPKAASNGDKNSKLNVESVPVMNGMKKGGHCK